METSTDEPPIEERERLGAHFAWVLALLRAQRAPEDAGRAARRAESLDQLEAYARRGRFPRNVVSTRWTPVFVDPRGATCAVADLMFARGAIEAVERIHREENLRYVEDLGEVVDRFGDVSGLTRAELALIQPRYCPEPFEPCVVATMVPSHCTLSSCCEEVVLPDGSPCDVAGNACAVAECMRGACVEVDPDPCDDEDPSTLDVCVRASGCVSFALPVAVPAAEQGEEARPHEEGCTLAEAHPPRGSLAPVLAALLLLALHRKARRA